MSESPNLERRELVFGFVAPIGVNKDLVEDCLRIALSGAEYRVEKISVTEQIERFAEPPQNAVVHQFLARKKRLMDAGDSLRQAFQASFAATAPERGDAVTLVSLIELRRRRREINESAIEEAVSQDSGDAQERLGSIPLANVAFLLDSLKTPDEIRLLKRIYGPAFVSIGIYAPPEIREGFLLERAEAKDTDDETVRYIRQLMRRDESGEDESGKKVPLGQNVLDSFHECDFILDSTSQKPHVIEQLIRLVELIFGNVYVTPSRDEMGLFLARAAQVRSGSLARQIGAAILRDDGSVAALGTNEAARPISGGQYWPEDDHHFHGRDMAYQRQDTSDQFREDMVKDVLDRLDRAGALASEHTATDQDGNDKSDAGAIREKRMQDLYYAREGALRRALLRDNIDYVRAVHAEASAIISAASHGIAIHDTRMITTTFPCHECARHIVAAGIKEVVYFAPYPKSAVKQLYADSVQVDPVPHHRDKRKVTFRTFVGVAPSRYLEFFTAVQERKDKQRGIRYEFKLRKAIPTLPYYTPNPIAAAVNNEPLELQPFIDFLRQSQTASQPPTTATPSTEDKTNEQ